MEAHLRAREAARDHLADRARSLRRAAQRAMTHLHRGQLVPSEMEPIERSLHDLVEEAHRADRHDVGVADAAVQEAVEAILLARVLDGGSWPGPSELGVDPEPYLMALGDLVGEVRRLALRAVTRGDVARGEEYLVLMESILDALLRFDTPRSVLTLKPKQDAARALIERTRGEVAVARMLDRARLPASLGSSG